MRLFCVSTRCGLASIDGLSRTWHPVIRFEVERFIRVSIYLRVETASPRPADEAEVGAMGRPSFIQVKEGRGEPEAVQVRRREEEE